MEQNIFIKTSDEKVICINEIAVISYPIKMTDGTTKRKISLKNKSEHYISEEDYWELEKVMKDNMSFFSLKKEKVPKCD